MAELSRAYKDASCIMKTCLSFSRGADIEDIYISFPCEDSEGQLYRVEAKGHITKVQKETDIAAKS